jgi:hypothetical protein
MPPLLRLSRFACWANCLVWRASPASPAATTLRQQMVAFPCGRVQLSASGCPLLLGQGAASAALHPRGGDIHSFMTQKGAKIGQRRTPNRAILGAIFGAIQGKIGRVGRLPEGISLLWRGAASIITLPLRKNRACGVVWDDFTRAQEQGTGTVPLPVRVRFPHPEFRTPSETGCVQACRL